MDENIQNDDLKEQLYQLKRTKQKLKHRIQKCYRMLQQQDDVGLFGDQDNESSCPCQQQNIDIDVEHLLKLRKYIMRLELEHDHVTNIIGNLMEDPSENDMDHMDHRSHTDHMDSRPTPVSSSRSSSSRRGIIQTSSFSMRNSKDPHQSRGSNHSKYSRRSLRNKDSESSGMDCCSWEMCHPPKRIEIIAVIVRVFPRSPGRKAGLRPGDFIIDFGEINASNYSGDPASLVEYAEHLENQTIRVRIFRAGKMNTKRLVPKAWRGCGLLGFRFGNVFK